MACRALLKLAAQTRRIFQNPTPDLLFEPRNLLENLETIFQRIRLAAGPGSTRPTALPEPLAGLEPSDDDPLREVVIV